MDKHTISRSPTLCAMDAMNRAAQASSPIEASYTAHRDAEQRRRATKDWLRQRQASLSRRA